MTTENSSRQIPLADLSRFAKKVDANFEAEVIRLIRSGIYLNGRHTSFFSESFRSYLNQDGYVLGVGSGTDALYLALASLNLPPKSSVGLVANAGGYARIAINRNNLNPVYISFESSEHLIDLEELEKYETGKIQAVIITHLYGNIVDMNRVVKICKSRKIKVIEDCAQAIGGSFGNQRVGTFGDVGCFSFYPTKNLGAIGDAGAIFTADEITFKRVKSLAQYGWGEKYEIDLSGGVNSRLDEIQALYLTEGLKSLDERNSLRRRAVASYRDKLGSLPIRFITKPFHNNVAHLLVCELPEGVDRTAFMEFLGSRGVAIGVHYPVLDDCQIAFSSTGDAEYSVAKQMIANIVTLPCFPELEEDEIVYVCNSIHEFFKGAYRGDE